MAAGRTADVVCGKPYPPIAEILIHTHGINPACTLMIVDRCIHTLQYIATRLLFLTCLYNSHFII